MKKKLLLPVFGLIALWSSNLIGQHAFADKGGSQAVHQARFNVFDYSNGKPIANAGLYDKTDKEIGKTDHQGTLTIALPASAADMYLFKSPGFSPVNIRLTHADKKFADYEVFLRPTPNASNDTDKTELVKVYVKQDPSIRQKENERDTSPSDVEFAVQLSATSRPIADKKTLKTWEELGPVFIHTENGLYKVRIGPFTTQESAKKVLLAVKERGKSDAFIVVQKGIENHKPYEYEAHRTLQPTPAPAPEPTPIAHETNTAEVQGDYKVRIASYLHPGAFNTTDVEQYGTLESYRKGEWTIMMIGGFRTAAAAKKVKDMVVAKGYTDAAVVVDREGILEEVE